MIAQAWQQTDWILLATVFILLSLSGFLALAETALVRMTRSKAAALADDHRRGSQAVLRLSASPDEFLNPLLLLILVCQLVSATLVGVLAEHQFGAAGLVVATVTEVVFIFVVFEAIPKNFAVIHPDSSALFAAPIVEGILSFWPIKVIAGILLNLAKWVLKPFGVNDDSHKVTESEIIAMASIAEKDKSIQEHERDFIHSVLEMGDTLVKEVMVPRVDMTCVDSSQTVQEVLDFAIAAGKSRFPVTGEDIDDIIGVVNLRWMLQQIHKGNAEKTIAEIGLRDPQFVPETRKVASLIEQFNQARHHLFIVVDEYGGTAGIITLEDVLEELVGELESELAEPQPVKERKALTEEEPADVPYVSPPWPRTLSARLNIDDANDEFDLDLPTDGSWDTVAGLVLTTVGGVPSVGATMEVGQYLITVSKVDRHRVEEVSIDLLSRLS